MCTALDSSLGNLDWLVVKEGKGAVCSKPPASKEGSTSTSEQQSTSADVTAETTAEATAEPPAAASPKQQQVHRQDSSEKPNLSYADLIKKAIQSAYHKKMTLNEIYRYITDNYVYYRNMAGTSWKNSIRHNLSLNKMFKKMDRSRGEPGKGSFWEIDPLCNGENTWYKAFRKPKSRASPYCEERGCTRLRHLCHTDDVGTPRVNPAIRALFLPHDNGMFEMPTPPAAASFIEYNEPVVQAAVCAGDSTGDSIGIQDINAVSGSNMSPIPENLYIPGLENSAGSLHSNLSDSFKNLYQSVFAASFNNQNFMKSTQDFAICQQDPGPSQPPQEAPDWLLLKQQLQSLGYGQEGTLLTSADTPSSIDMRQFSNMLGSRGEQDLSQWLSQCNADNLAASLQGYLLQNKQSTSIKLEPGCSYVADAAQQQPPPSDADAGQQHDFGASFDFILANRMSDFQKSINQQIGRPTDINGLMTKTDPVMGSVHTQNEHDPDTEDEFDWEALIN